MSDENTTPIARTLYLSNEEYEWLLNSLDEPPKELPRLRALLNKHEDGEQEPPAPRLFTHEEVAKALSVVVDVTLDRVQTSLNEATYGTVTGKDKDGNPKLKVVVDWKDVERTLKKLREKPDE